MDKKIVKKSGGLFVAVMALLSLLSLASIVLMILTLVIPDFVQGIWYIPVFGEFLLPLQTLINSQEANGMIYILISAVMFIISIWAMVCARKTYKFSTKSKKASFVGTLIFSAILFAFATFNLVIICIYYNVFNLSSGVIMSVLIQGIDPGILANVVTIKYIVVCALIIISSLLVFFVFLLNREKEKKQVVKTLFNVNFYSDEYEQKEQKIEEKAEEAQQEQVVEQKPMAKPKKQSQDLLTRIMQLNELKDTGQITEVEYTRLRQKAIRRYKV